MISGEGGLIDLVTLGIVPGGLILIMFGLGVSLRPADFLFVGRNPRAVGAGLIGQLVLMPALAIAVSALLGLTGGLAMGLFILAASPAGVTSNAMTHVARGNVALAVTLTVLTSSLCVVAAPLYLSWALGHYYVAADAPHLSAPATMATLARMTVLPIAAGMAVRRLMPNAAAQIARWSRPAALVVLFSVITLELLVSFDVVVRNLWRVGPAVFLLNVLAMTTGLALGRLMRLDRRDSLTIALEVGIHNATMAMYLSLTLLRSVDLAITAIIYGFVMTLNATVFIRVMAARGYPGDEDVAAAASTRVGASG
ncbi:bile acid:sodium symporter family protein [Sphingomonas sp.]|jgi:BASS family bile acid:Na+ symporter|uniref:bile acid:sodium symporter family protein n=1 Tax=Sphingomonas sp. TaxID=28214 RepID=UPI002DECE0F9|nr:bile acid:sodium symporter family protein [Sphingomonas sp.]